MRTTLKRLVRLSVGYSLVTLIGPLFTLFLTPLYTRVLTPADYGVVDVALTLGSFLSIFVMLGMDQALAAHFFEGDEARKRNLVTTAVLYVITAGLLISGLVFWMAEPLALLLFKDPARRVTLQLLSLLALFAPLYGVLGAALRLRMGVRRVNALGLAYLFSSIGLNILFVLILGMKATGIITANVLANAIGAAVGLALVWKPLRGHFEMGLLKPVLASGLGLLPGALGYIVLANIDRLLLTQYVSPSEIGLYAIANKLASMLYVGFSAIWNAWWPMALEMADKPDAPRQYARMFEYFAAGSLLAALVLGLFSPEILQIFTTKSYVAAAPYALVLMIYAGPLGVINSALTLPLFIKKTTQYLSIGFVVSAVINVGLNLLMLNALGTWAAVWATVVAGFVLTLVLYYTGQRVLFINFRWVRLLTITAIYLLMIVASLTIHTLMNSFALRLGMIAIFIIMLFVTRIFLTSQFDLAARQLRKAVQKAPCL